MTSDEFREHLLSRLHWHIQATSAERFRTGHLVDAAESSIRAVFSYLQNKTGLTLDGAELVNDVFSTSAPKLAFGDLNRSTIRDRQVGFMELLRGLYKGVRSPLAHHAEFDLDSVGAYEYLMLASWCCRQIDETSSKWFVHPTGDESRRGPVRPCRFEISSQFERDSLKRWERYADVLVQLQADSAQIGRSRFVYLIPSGQAPDVYSKPEFWRTNSELLKEKQAATRAFARAHLTEVLEGGYFVHQRRDGTGLATVYSTEYDACLRDAYRTLHGGQ